MRKTRTFTDLDLSFNINPNTKDIALKIDDNAIKNSLKNIILTRHYERPFFSHFGSNVTSLLFDNPTPGVSSIMKQEIFDIIKYHEPRVEIISIDLNYALDLLTVDLSITFRIINTLEPLVLNFALKRVR